MDKPLVLVKFEGRIVAAEHVAFHTLPEYRHWHAMWARCANPNVRNYARYGGAGIKVCEAWQDFTRFYFDVGPRPSHHYSVDRYPNGAGDYEPGNVRWATRTEQALNTKKAVYVEFEGKQERLILLCRRLGVPYTHVAPRIKGGWSIEDALSIPINRHKNPRKVKNPG